VKVGRDELSLVEFTLEPVRGPEAAHPQAERRLVLRPRRGGRAPTRRRDPDARRRRLCRRATRNGPFLWPPGPAGSTVDQRPRAELQLSRVSSRHGRAGRRA
jgi:hypothetical protein